MRVSSLLCCNVIYLGLIVLYLSQGVFIFIWVDGDVTVKGVDWIMN